MALQTRRRATVSEVVKTVELGDGLIPLRQSALGDAMRFRSFGRWDERAVVANPRASIAGFAVIGGLCTALFAAPSGAFAACTVTAAGGVDCATTVTTDTTNTNGATTASTDRVQLFTNGVGITGDVQSGATVSGFGLQITAGSSTTQTITFNNLGTVTTGQGVQGLELDGNGGLVTYTGNGSVSASGGDSFSTFGGLYITNTNNGGVNIGSASSPVTGNFSGPQGILVQNLSGGLGDVNIYLSGGTVTSTTDGGGAIFGDTRFGGTGNVFIQTVNSTTIGTSPQGFGIAAETTSGNATIISNANIGTSSAPVGTGLFATVGLFSSGGTQAVTGAINIQQTGGSIFAGNQGGVAAGIYGASDGTGGISISTSAGSTINMPGSGTTGIAALDSGTAGTVGVVANGNIATPDIGIDAEINNSANASAVSVLVGGALAANVTGVNAVSSGGAISVTTSSGATINAPVAIATSGGPATINNGGSIYGDLALSGSGNVVNNAGTWQANTGGSFGAGTTINNSGTQIVVGNQTLSGGSSLVYNNMATGVINLANGGTGNSLTISGNYVGTQGSQLLVNLNPQTGQSDKLIIGGTATGTTAIYINPVNQSALSAPVTIVQSSPTSTAKFTLADPNQLMFKYNFSENASGNYVISSGGASSNGVLAGSAVQTVAAIVHVSIGGIQQQLFDARDEIRRTGSTSSTPAIGFAEETDALSYNKSSDKSNPLAMAVKAPAAPPEWAIKPGLWTQFFGNWDTRSGSTGGAGFNQFTNTYGWQSGLDGLVRNVFRSGDALLAGVVASWTDSLVTFDSFLTRARVYGPGVGLYGTYLSGGFSTDMTVKGDFFDLNETDTSVGLADRVGLSNLTVSQNVQYKWDLQHNSFVEPTAGYTYNRVSFGGDAAVLGLTSGDVVRLQGGARVGTTFDWLGVQFEPYVLGLVYDNVVETGTPLSTLGVTGLTDEGLLRGQFDVDLDMDFGHGWTSFVRGEVSFGEYLLAGSFFAGARKQW